MKWVSALSLMLLIEILLFPAEAIEPITINQTLSSKNLGGFCDYFVDQDENKSIDDLISIRKSKEVPDWQVLEQEKRNLGYIDAPVWIRIPIKNNSDKDIDFYLQLTYQLINYVDFYYPDGDGVYQEIKTGSLTKFKQRPVNHREFLFPLRLKAGDSALYFFRLKSKGVINVPLEIVSTDKFHDSLLQESIILFMFYAVMLAMAIYHCFILLSTRDISHFFYILYITFVSLTFISLIGHGFQYLWPESPIWDHHSRAIFMLLLAFSLTQFMRYFCQIKKYSPLGESGLKFLAFLSIILALLIIPIDRYRFSIQLSLVIGGISVVYMSTLATYLLIKYRSRQIAFFLSSYIIFFGFILFNILFGFGLMEENIMTIYGKHIGAIAQILLLSLGLADRINQLRNEAETANQNLQKSEQKFRAIFNQTFQFIGLLEPNGSILAANKTFLEITGNDESEVMGKLLWEIPGDFFSKEHRSLIKNAVKKASEGRFVRFEILQSKKDRPFFAIDFSLKPIKDERGRAILLIPEGREVTDRKTAENEILHLRNLLSNVINSMPSVLAAVDLKGRVIQWNTEAENMTGIAVEKAQGCLLADLIPQITDEVKNIQKAIKEKETLKNTKVPFEIDGQTQCSDITIYPLIDSSIQGAVIRIDNVTERVQMEEMIIQNEKMLSMGGLAAGMAHEINNPLAGIMQTTYVISNRLLDINLPANIKTSKEIGIDFGHIRAFMEKRGIVRMINSLNEAGQRIADIVNNMLSFARISDDKKTHLALEELLDKTLELATTDYDLKKEYDFKKIKVIREYVKDLPLVPCEETKIQQVILNIFRNGAQAMQEAGTEEPQFTIRTRFEEDANMILLEIEDNGPGMEKEIQKRVFEPFFTTKPVGEGTGLGLSVSYFIITESHGGELRIVSQPGCGAKFCIRLPLDV